MPRPPVSRSSAGSACENISKTVGRCRASMPMPESRTEHCASSPSRDELTWIDPPSGVNLLALTSRLRITCVRRAASASSQSGCSASERVSSWRAAVISGLAASMAASMASVNVTGSSRRRSLPCGDPRHLEQVVDQARDLRELAPEHLARPAEVGVGDVLACAAGRSRWRIGASGLRSSCASVARNSSLRRWSSASCSLAASAARRASSSSRSYLCRSVATITAISSRPARRGCGGSR